MQTLVKEHYLYYIKPDHIQIDFVYLKVYADNREIVHQFATSERINIIKIKASEVYSARFANIDNAVIYGKEGVEAMQKVFCVYSMLMKLFNKRPSMLELRAD